MANIASGYVSIDSTDKEFLEDLKNKINDGPFSYGRPVDIIENPDGLSVYFKKKMPGSWEDAWVFFEYLMASTDYAFQQALIESEINGQDCQGDRVAMVISKQSGEALITRENLSDEEDVAEKKLKQPLETVMSPTAKLLVASLLVKVTVNVPSLVVAPSLTALLPSVAVIVMVGAVAS